MAKKGEISIEKLRKTDLGELSYKQLRKAYTVYRDALRKRFVRLGQGTAAQKAFAAPFLQEGGYKELKKLSQLDALRRTNWNEESIRREMLQRVQELQSIEKSDRSSLAGWARIEQRTVKSLQERGYNNINKSNLKAFGEYMERMRSVFGNKIFPSDEAAEAFDAVVSEYGDLDPNELFDLILNEMGDSFGVDLFA